MHTFLFSSLNSHISFSAQVESIIAHRDNWNQWAKFLPSVNSSFLLAVSVPLSVGIITASTNSWFELGCSKMHFYGKTRGFCVYMARCPYVRPEVQDEGHHRAKHLYNSLKKTHSSSRTHNALITDLIAIQMYAGGFMCHTRSFVRDRPHLHPFAPFEKEAWYVPGTHALCSQRLSSTQLHTWNSLQLKASCTKCSPKHSFQKLHKCQLH